MTTNTAREKENIGAWVRVTSCVHEVCGCGCEHTDRTMLHVAHGHDTGCVAHARRVLGRHSDLDQISTELFPPALTKVEALDTVSRRVCGHHHGWKGTCGAGTLRPPPKQEERGLGGRGTPASPLPSTSLWEGPSPVDRLRHARVLPNDADIAHVDRFF